MAPYVALAIFVVSFSVFFLAIVLTIVLGGISRRGDKRLGREARLSAEQRLPTDFDPLARRYRHA
jgi:hypothetical protein